MTPSGAYSAMLNLKAATDEVKRLAKACDDQQRGARETRGIFISISDCESWRDLTQAQQARRKLRDEYGV